MSQGSKDGLAMMVIFFGGALVAHGHSLIGIGISAMAALYLNLRLWGHM